MVDLSMAEATSSVFHLSRLVPALQPNALFRLRRMMRPHTFHVALRRVTGTVTIKHAVGQEVKAKIMTEGVGQIGVGVARKGDSAILNRHTEEDCIEEDINPEGGWRCSVWRELASPLFWKEFRREECFVYSTNSLTLARSVRIDQNHPLAFKKRKQPDIRQHWLFGLGWDEKEDKDFTQSTAMAGILELLKAKLGQVLADHEGGEIQGIMAIDRSTGESHVLNLEDLGITTKKDDGPTKH